MQAWGIILFSCLFFVLLGLEASESGIYLHLDMENQAVLPRNFRLANDSYTMALNPIPSRDHLERLNISGSGQFSEESLKEVIKKIPSQKIIVVDLRQENHAFANGHSISWRDEIKGNFYNEGKRGEEIETSENTKLAAILKSESIILDPTEANTQLTIERGETERQLVQRLGFEYIRFYVQDTTRPVDYEVDRFVEIVKTLPKDTWLHVHCGGGLGRTTTFMILFDMMHHAEYLDAETFIRRHRALGGQDLFNLHDQPGDPEGYKHLKAVARLKFLFDFHQYCRESNHFSISWSEWNFSQEKSLPLKTS